MLKGRKKGRRTRDPKRISWFRRIPVQIFKKKRKNAGQGRKNDDDIVPKLQ